ncbi:MAG: alkaline shock response membrane anchor protein AmaP [Candidatus Omnitrophica bacterium]|nr:alkaline shock response membrane anchor protein AmaP [Candidatus Omnitrophota bacterium]
MFFIAFLLYTVFSFGIGIFLVALTFDFITADVIMVYLDTYQKLEYTHQLLIGAIGVLVILLWLLMVRRYLGGVWRKERALTIQTAQGQVSISLFAIEDMVRKTLESRRELTQVKPRVSVNRRGIDIKIRGSLKTEVNLKDFIASVQVEIKKKLAYLLGEKGEIRIQLAIRKLAFASKSDGIIDDDPEVPFRNY